MVGDSSDGVYYPDGSFKSAAQIRVGALRAGEVINHSPMPAVHDFDWWSEEMIRRRDVRLEQEARPESVEIEIATDKPVCVAQIGDNHVAAMYHAYEMQRKHINIVKEHPLMYAAFGGDITDSFFFNPAQDKAIADNHEQYAFSRAMMERLGKDKILWACEGDHDMWCTKMGTSFYEEFQHRYEAYLLRGATRVGLTLSHPGGHREKYNIVTAHRLPGFSMYTKTHPAARASRFGLQGADSYGCFHTHQKGIAYQPVRSVGGSILQTLWVAGPYKWDDDYAQKLGLDRLDPYDETFLGPVWLIFYPDKHRIEACHTVDEAIDRLAPHLR